MPLDLHKDELKKRFPSLVKEMDESTPEGTSKVKLKADSSGYQPNVMDFLARCENDKQALEIIDYLEKRGEVLPSEAGALRLRISRQGVRSVAKKRAPGHYFREFGD